MDSALDTAVVCERTESSSWSLGKKVLSGFLPVKCSQHVGWIFKLLKNLQIFHFFFRTLPRFCKILFVWCLKLSPCPPPAPRHQIPDRNYVAKPSSNVTWSHAPNVNRKCHARRTVTWKLRDRRRTANTTTQDSIHVHPMWLGQSIIYLFIYLFIHLVTHKTLYNMNKSC